MIGKTYLTSRDICEVAMHTVETVYTREDMEKLVKILDITYAKSDLEY